MGTYLLGVFAIEYCLIDSLPIGVVNFAHSKQQHRWYGHAAYGFNASKKETVYGFRLHALMSESGIILDYALVPANVADIHIAPQLLRRVRAVEVLGDKAYLDDELHARLREDPRRQVAVVTPRRLNQKRQHPRSLTRAINSLRQGIEAVFSQLAGQLNIERNRAKCMSGLISRIHTKLAAHALGQYINLITDRPINDLASLKLV